MASLLDLPTISDASHSHTVYGLANMGTALSQHTGSASSMPFWENPSAIAQTPRRMMVEPVAMASGYQAPPKPKETVVGRRLVQVFIADSNESIPLEDSLLYSGAQKLTDLTDQELFFEIDMKDVLATHNAKRITIVDKKVKERVEHLEPAKIRDLKMVVVTVANF